MRPSGVFVVVLVLGLLGPGVASDGRRRPAYFDEWAEFYRDYYGFDSWKVTYCTVDVGAAPTAATGNLSPPTT